MTEISIDELIHQLQSSTIELQDLLARIENLERMVAILQNPPSPVGNE